MAYGDTVFNRLCHRGASGPDLGDILVCPGSAVRGNYAAGSVPA